MRTRTSQSFILPAILLAAAGCDDGLSLHVSQSTSMTETGSVSPQSPAIFYGDTGLPSERAPVLSDLELTHIIDKVAGETKEPIWFIRVRPYINFREDIVERGTVIVYLVPERQMPRIRAGRAYEMYVDDDGADISSPRDYLQISKADQTFAKRLTLPSASDLPFYRPDIIDPDSRRGPPVSEDELIRIVDFARQPSIYERLADRRISPEQAQRMPLLGVQRFRGTTIFVQFGFEYDPGWGYGVEVTIKSTPDGYELLGCGEWIV